MNNQEIRILETAGCSQDIIAHCCAVSKKAVALVEQVTINIDKELVRLGGLFHDIGRSRTQGIRHALEGAEILSNLGYPDSLIHIVETHIGAGITAAEAERLGLPKRNYLPLTPEAKIVSYADNLIHGIEEIPFPDALDTFKKMLGSDHESIHLFLKQHQEIQDWIRQS
ncbi:MAG: HDIG domain-containing metalloprotein [Nitrospirota bacterium]